MTARTPRQDFETIGEWHIALEREFVRAVESGCDFTSEDIRKFVGLPPSGSPNKFGAAWRLLLHAHRRNLRVTGLKRSAIKASRGRRLPVYRKVS